MHGKGRSDGTTAYLSIDMPNTFSMSPEYVRGFVEKHALEQPRVDVFSKLRERAKWLFREGVPGYGSPVRVVQGDATRLSALKESLGDLKITAAITSPPYLGILRYGAFNWIRLWLLGFDQYSIDRLLDGTDSIDRYLSFMLSFLRSLSNVLEVGAPAVLVIGDVVEFGHHVELADRVWEEVSGLVPFEFVERTIDNFDVKAKTTRIWGQTKKGQATPVDRVLVLRRIQATRTTGPVPSLAAVLPSAAEVQLPE
jgi:site-specific DNA-methyltransferase (adenine-specific)